MDSFADWPNLAALMFDRARRTPERPMLRCWRDGAWRGLTGLQFARHAAALARALRAAGLGAGERVMIVSENRPEYPIAEAALMAIRAVPVPAYTTNTVADHAHILRDCGARMAIVSTPALAARLIAAGAEAGGTLQDLVVIEPGAEAAPGGPRRLIWDELVAPAALPDAPWEDIAAEAARILPGDLACLIYTSGTGGAPKGVMVPHRAVLDNCRGACSIIATLPEVAQDVYLSFLPLSHAYERTVGQFFMMAIGAEIVYGRGVETLGADMVAIHPTIITLVPRILEVIRARILAGVARAPRWRRLAFARAMTIGAKRVEGAPLTAWERLLDPLLDRLVRRRLRGRFGGRLRVAISGGARLEPEVGRFFLSLGVALLQGYGQTEAGPVITVNRPLATRIETVGPAMPGVELRIAADGEILVRGDLVMLGYWNHPEESAAALRDGWLHTGDIGMLDAQSYLRITDRKKDMIVLSGGENVAPARIEGVLVAEPEIAQAAVFGEGQAGLAALLVPAEESDEPAVSAAVARVNARLSVTERIRRHAVVAPFTIENGMLTATQKVRRHVVSAVHARLLETLAR